MASRHAGTHDLTSRTSRPDTSARTKARGARMKAIGGMINMAATRTLTTFGSGSPYTQLPTKEPRVRTTIQPQNTTLKRVSRSQAEG